MSEFNLQAAENLDAIFDHIREHAETIRQADAEIQGKLDVATMLEECGVEIRY